MVPLDHLDHLAITAYYSTPQNGLFWTLAPPSAPTPCHHPRGSGRPFPLGGEAFMRLVRVPWRRLSVYGVNSPVHAFYVYSTTARGAVFSPPSSESSSSESTVLAGAHERLVLAHISAQSRASGGRMTDIEDGPPFITFHLVCTTSTTACERQPGYTAGA